MLDGVYVANVTPFGPGPAHAVDLDSYLAHVRWLAGMGVDGIVPFGTNGEGPSVTTAEKQAVLAEVLSADLPLSVLPTVAEGTLPGTVDMLEYLNGVDIPAVLVLPPYFFTPVETEGLRLFYQRVLEVSRHPVVIYHIPKYAVPVPADLVTTLGVWGVKDSGGQADYADAVHAAGQGVLLGTEDDYPGRLPVATGVISALANIVPEQVRELYACVRAGDQARAGELSEHLQQVRAMTKEYASPGVLKALAQARHGAPMGTVRPPLVPLPADYDVGRALDVMGVTGLG
ncbi:dihydrodipicolinate synthase family protein [Ornithinimicrobium sp. LYQ103]|uniref:dihydrodipicolinate synthase family protein n=1 Tax=Ornithinimicrobium sp. LYQ103 TaxID=3378796 RepID=UPI0038549BD3